VWLRCSRCDDARRSVSEQEILHAMKQHGECCDGRVGAVAGRSKRNHKAAALRRINPNWQPSRLATPRCEKSDAEQAEYIHRLLLCI
jgi:hypothetical protein